MLTGWIFFIVYMVIIVYLGALGGKKTKSLEDFTVAGRTLGPIVVGIATAATFSSAATFLGGPGWLYAWGYSALWYPFSMTIGPFIGLFVVSRIVRNMGAKMKSLTVADYVGHRYNSDLLRVLIGVLCLFNIFYVAGQMAGAGILMNSLLGIPYFWGVALATVIVVWYISVGGSYADIYTDTFQGVIMMFVAITLFVASYIAVGGFSGLAQNLAAQDPALLKPLNPDSSLYFGWMPIIGSVMYIPLMMTNPQFVNKFFALKKGTNMRVFVLVVSIAIGINALTPVTGLFGRALVGSGIRPDTIVPTLTTMLFPPVIGSLLLVCIMAALMSTVDGIYVVLASVFGADFYKNTIVKKKLMNTDKLSNEQVEIYAMKITKGITVLVGIVSFIMVYKPPAFLGNIIIIGILGLTSGLTGPVFIGSWWRRSTPTAAIVSLFAGAGTFLVLMIGVGLNTYHAGLYGMIVGGIVQIVVSYLTPAMSEDYLQEIGLSKVASQASAVTIGK